MTCAPALPLVRTTLNRPRMASNGQLVIGAVTSLSKTVFTSFFCHKRLALYYDNLHERTDTLCDVFGSPQAGDVLINILQDLLLVAARFREKARSSEKRKRAD
jgi:hypothetical protein